MDNDNLDNRHARDSELFPIDPVLREGLVRSLDTVSNVLDALTRTGQESLLREKRIEEIEKMSVPIAEYLRKADHRTTAYLQQSAAQLVQSQHAVIRSRSDALQDIAIPEITSSLDEVTEAGYASATTPFMRNIMDVQQEMVFQLKWFNNMLAQHDYPITQRIMSIGKGVEVAIAQNDTAPLRFIQRGLINLIVDAKEIDEQIMNMPMKNEQWIIVQGENNKLRQLLAQFI